MTSKMTLTYADFGGEKSTAQFQTVAMTALNFDAQNILIDNLKTSIGALTEGLLVKDSRLSAETGAGAGQAASPTAQREGKWLVTFSDDVTGKKYQREIPCPLLNANTILQDIGGNANIADALWLSFIANLEAVVVSEVGNSVSFVSARHVGRNN